MKPSQLSTLAQWNNIAACMVGGLESHGGVGGKTPRNFSVACCTGDRRNSATDIFSRIMGEFCGHVDKGRQYARLFKRR